MHNVDGILRGVKYMRKVKTIKLSLVELDQHLVALMDRLAVMGLVQPKEAKINGPNRTSLLVD